jgi:pimeloyl-ACP methyl ester carboxylesterase
MELNVKHQLLTILCVVGFSVSNLVSASELNLETCFVPGIKSKALCGTLDMAENPALDISADNTISLNVVVLPKVKEQSKELPVMFLAGGPGQAATELANGLNRAMSDIRQEHDIILVDQRGTGKSNGLLCESEEYVDVLELDSDKLDLEKEVKDCLAGFSNYHLPSYNTYQSIEDFEAVRHALGHKKIHIFGGSYGTRAGFAYLKNHPESIQTAILDSNAPMELVVGLFGKTSERAFDFLVEDCKAHQYCNESFPNLKQDYLNLLIQLEKPITQSIYHPITGLKVEVILTKSKVTESLRGTLYALSTRQLLPYVVHASAKGDYRPLAAMISQNTGSEHSPGSLYTGLTMNIICNEDMPRAVESDFKQDADNYFNGELGFTNFTDVCKYWPKWQAPEDFAEPVTVDVPVLLFSGKYDPVTPPAYGDMADKNLPNSKHVVIKDGSHVASLSMCMDAVKEFMQSATFDGVDFSCADKSVPSLFFTNLNQLH